MFKPSKNLFFRYLLILSTIIWLPSCFLKKNEKTKMQNLDEQKTLVFVHGTLPPIIAKIVNQLDCPLGITKSTNLSRFSFTGRIAKAMHKADPVKFNLENFYFYGWSGKLCFQERKKTAEKLYHELKKIKGKIILIGHSHGGNVALNLGQIAQEHNDKDFKIDQLILMATPVQHATEKFVESPIFKQVISLYSRTDNIQILDPQGLYDETQKIKPEDKDFFSKRMFHQSDKVIHIRILYNKSNPSHLDFITPKFAKFIPQILKIVKQQALSSDQVYTINLDNRLKVAHLVHLYKIGTQKKYK